MPKEPAAVTPPAPAADDDAGLLAELDAIDAKNAEADRAAPKPKKVPSAESGNADDEEGEEPAEGDEDADEERDPAAAEDEPDGDEDADDEEKPAEEDAPDPKLAKQLEAVHRAKKRAQQEIDNGRAKLAQERQAFDQERKGFQVQLTERQARDREYDLVSSRVKSSPRAAVDLLRRLGLPAAQWSTVANIAYAQSDQAPADFKRQWGGDDGGTSTELEELRRESAENRKWREEQEQQRQQAEQRQQGEAKVASYIDEVAASVDAAKHVLIANALKKNPQRAKSRLRMVAEHLYRESGGGLAPSAEDVVTEAERRLREDAEEHGLVIPSTKTEPKNADKKKTAKTLSSNLAPPTRPRLKPATRDEEDRELIRELDELDRSNR